MTAHLQRPRAGVSVVQQQLLLLLLLCGMASSGGSSRGSEPPIEDWLVQLGAKPEQAQALRAAGYSTARALSALPDPEAALKQAGLGLKVRKKVARALQAKGWSPPAPGGLPAMPTEVLRAQSLYQQGKLPEAVDAVHSAIATSPADPRLFGNLGSILASMNTRGHREEALHAFRRSLQLDPNQSKLRAQVVSMLASLGRAEEASDLMEDGMNGNGLADLTSTLSVAAAHQQLGHSAEALAVYKSAMAMTEDDPAGSNKVHLAVARFRLLAGDTSASLDEIVGCKARGYATAAVRMLEAEALMRLDRVAEAETALRWVLDSAAKAMIRDGDVVWTDDYAGDELSEVAAAEAYKKQALAALSKLLMQKLPLPDTVSAAELEEIVDVARRNINATSPWPCSDDSACWQKERYMATLQLATVLDVASTHTAIAPSTNSGQQSNVQAEAMHLFQKADAVADALLRERSLSPWSKHGRRAGMVALEHLSIQLREQARPYARAILNDGGGDSVGAYGIAALRAQDDATERWQASTDRGGWGGECDKLPPHATSEPVCTIERRSADSLTQVEFENEFAALGRPVIITGVGAGGLFDKWRAKQEWRLAEMIARHQHTQVTVARSSDIVALQAKGEESWAEKLMNMTLSDYITKYMQGQRQEDASTDANPMYLFRSVPLPDMASYYEHPHYFSNRSFFHMHNRARDAKALFFLGPANSGAYTHQHTAAWNAVVYGAKRWYLLPPAARHGPDTEMQGGMIEWLRTIKNRLPVSALECTQYAGELLFVPASWWHGVLNLCDTVGVAVEVGVPIPEV